MYCGKCGKENTDGVRFCIHCGSDLAQQTPQPVSPAETVDDASHFGGDVLDISDHADSAEVSETTAFAVRPGKVLAGRYRIVERLGAGGMGEVFKAVDTELNDLEVAIKVLPPILAANKRSVNRLRTEAAISLKLTHRNICRLQTFHTDGKIKFLVMEYIPGKTLEDILEDSTDRRLKLSELLPIARDVAAALDFAHGLKPPILHRDVKPSNVMVTPSGRAKVLDFGIARELKESMTRMTGKDTSGTLLYMSPEQFTGGAPAVASDIYSFTAMLYECLAGHAPFWQGSISHQLLNQQPPRILNVSVTFNDALQMGLAKNVADRPTSARMLVEMLEGKVQPAIVRQVDRSVRQEQPGQLTASKKRHRPALF